MAVDIYARLCTMIGADIFGKLTLRLDGEKRLDLADGEIIRSVRGTVIGECDYSTFAALESRLVPDNVILRVRFVSPIKIKSASPWETVFEREIEAVYREV